MNKKQTEKRSLKKKVKKRNTNKRTLKKHNTKRNKRTLKNNKRKSNKKKHFVGGAAAEENADAPTNEAELVEKVDDLFKKHHQHLASKTSIEDIHKMIQDLMQFIKVYQENILVDHSNSESNSDSNNQDPIIKKKREIYEKVRNMCDDFQRLDELKTQNINNSTCIDIFYCMIDRLRVCKEQYDRLKHIYINIKDPYISKLIIYIDGEIQIINENININTII